MKQYLAQPDRAVDVLRDISESIRAISQSLDSTAFWDTQWFAALVGASAAISVSLVEKFLAWRRKQQVKILEYCRWLNEQLPFRAPNSLLNSALSTSYGRIEIDNATGEKNELPDKPLGEKMIIELRRDLKWWLQPGRKLRRLFQRYESVLAKFDDVSEDGHRLQESLLGEAQSVYERIENYAFEVTGETEDTAL